jgi:8-oxo-dGTP pyrophosphatase MutT (NUDIX family)
LRFCPLLRFCSSAIIRPVKPKQPRSAGAVVFRRTDQGIRLLMLRAYRNWDFPKGIVDPGEEQLDTARREVREETGLSEIEFPFGEEFKETLPYSGQKIARYYLAETTEHDIELPVSPELKRPEHHEFRWVSFDEAQELLPPRLTVVLDWARQTIVGN